MKAKSNEEENPMERDTPQVASHRRRLCYIEEKVIAKELYAIAQESGLNVSDVIRLATKQFLRSGAADKIREMFE